MRAPLGDSLGGLRLSQEAYRLASGYPRTARLENIHVSIITFRDRIAVRPG